MQHLINTYGYAIVLIGTFLEGETILVMAGIAAKLGYLKLPWVALAAFAGSLAGDQLYFHLGRRYGTRILRRRKNWDAKIKRVYSTYSRYEIAVLLGFRFAYGLRTATPIALGAGRMVSPLKFLMFNAVSAALWSVFVSTLGFIIGHGAELILGNIKRYEIAIMSMVAAVGFGIWAWQRWRK
ncbi:MAG: DedA family protein [Gammaproteobacteria bacterium]